LIQINEQETKQIVARNKGVSRDYNVKNKGTCFNLSYNTPIDRETTRTYSWAKVKPSKEGKVDNSQNTSVLLIRTCNIFSIVATSISNRSK
jgi:hypothetical protein